MHGYGLLRKRDTSFHTQSSTHTLAWKTLNQKKRKQENIAFKLAEEHARSVFNIFIYNLVLSKIFCSLFLLPFSVFLFWIALPPSFT